MSNLDAARILKRRDAVGGTREGVCCGDLYVIVEVVELEAIEQGKLC
jgi:hypothetical protein